MPPPSNLNSRSRVYAVVRIALGGTLLITAGLKVHSLATGYWTPNILLTAPRLLVAAVEVEAILGLLLLSGRIQRAVWGVSLVFFVCLAGGSLYLALEGQQDCGCLGAVRANPWWTFGFDAAAVLALAFFRPRETFGSHRFASSQGALKVAGGAVLILILVGAVFLLAVNDPQDALARLRGDSVTIEPALGDAGDGSPGEIREMTYFLRNHTDHEVRVIGGLADCKCVTTRDLPLTIPPGESRPIGIGAKFGGSPGRFQHEFVLYLDDRLQSMVVGRFSGRLIGRANP